MERDRGEQLERKRQRGEMEGKSRGEEEIETTEGEKETEGNR